MAGREDDVPALLAVIRLTGAVLQCTCFPTLGLGGSSLFPSLQEIWAGLLLACGLYSLQLRVGECLWSDLNSGCFRVGVRNEAWWNTIIRFGLCSGLVSSSKGAVLVGMLCKLLHEVVSRSKQRREVDAAYANLLAVEDGSGASSGQMRTEANDLNLVRCTGSHGSC